MHDNHRDEEPCHCKGGIAVDWANGCPVPILVGKWRKGYPYFQCLKKNNRFMWTSECEYAFLKLKEYLANPPVLCKPLPGTPLRLYFVVIEREISSVIVQEHDQVQKLIYFVSKVLQGLEI